MKKDIPGNLKNAWKAIVGGFGYVFHYHREMSKALLGPFTMAVIVNVIFINLPNEFLAFRLLLSVISLVLYTVIAVTVHRTIILGPGSVPEWGLWPLSSRELRFAIYFVGVSLILSLIQVPGAFLSYVPVFLSDYEVLATLGKYLWFFATSFLCARFFLVFPSIAVDETPTLGDAWEATQGHALMIFLVVILVPTAVYESAGLLVHVPLVSHLWAAVEMFLLVIFIATLSVAYRLISE